MGLRWRMAALAAVFAVSVVLVNPYVRGDGNGYFAWLASAVVDHDLDFRNQYRHADPLFRQTYLDESGQPLPSALTSTGHVKNQWAVGPAVLWAPWFLAAHAVVSARGGDSQDGFAPAYRRACAAGTVFYALAAMWLSVLVAVRLKLSRPAAIAAAVAVWGASPLLVYAYALPFHVHALAAFTVAWFLWYWIAGGRFERLAPWAWWGALAGLMGMTYHVDAVFMLVVLAPALDRWRAGERGRLAAALAIFAVTALIASAPQWIGKLIVYGNPFRTGYEDQFYWFAPRLLMVSFSRDHGVVLWTPVVAVGALGFLWLARRHRALKWLAAAAAVFYYVIASYQNWDGLSSFGNRFFVSLTMLVVIGVAAALDAAWRRGAGARTVAVLGLLVLVAWNIGLAFQWGTKMLPNRGSVGVTQVAEQQWLVPQRMLSLVQRYLKDRDALVLDIEKQDQQEWDAYRKKR